MEFVKINDFSNSNDMQVVKKVPILTDQLMATILLIEPNTTLPSHIHKDLDEIHYIIEGTGKITIGKDSRTIDEGLMILVPKNLPHNFTTSNDKLIVASICPVTNHPVAEKVKSKPKGVKA